MKAVYPIILTPISNGFLVTVPDLEINTEGNDLADAIYMARDAIGLWGICTEDLGQSIPVPQTLSPEHAKDDIVTLVDVDFDAYRRAHEERAIRKNVTIPSWLNDLAEKNQINFSATLQAALKEQLNVNK